MEDGEYNIKEAYKKLIIARDSHRAIEEIFVDLQRELRPVREESFLVHAMRLFMELGDKSTSPLYAHLQSPMRQTLYMIDVYYSILDRTGEVDMEEGRWDRIATLLDEIEMNYFVDIGFPNGGDLFHDERDKKIEVSLATFLGYYGNALLSYEEQTLDRIEKNLKPYNDYIQSHYGFTIDEAIKFILHTRKLNNDKLNDIFRPFAETFSFYSRNPEEWRKLTSKFEERGAFDPYYWWYQPELRGMVKPLTTSPGEVNLHSKEELLDVDISPGSLKSIVDFFLYDKSVRRGQVVYYADKHYSESHPIIQLDERFVCSVNKFLLEGLYFRIDEDLRKDSDLGQKYKQGKDEGFERKVLEVFREFFPNGTKIFTNYSVDGGVSENDMLVIIGDTCIVVEIKDCGFRAPFRNPVKAYDRIKRDFGNAVQLGYDQCKRVENILLMGSDVEIVDAGNGHKRLYTIKSRRICAVWSIVVTDFKYGAIQTNLGFLLNKDTEALYPWSVCIDDIEAFFLLLRKVQKSIAPSRFLEFLDYRERMQEHVVCFDELELCGWYLSDRKQFMKYADSDMMINTSPNMGTVFDAYYHVVLGFKNELDMEYKKDYRLEDYPRRFDVNIVTGNQIIGD